MLRFMPVFVNVSMIIHMFMLMHECATECSSFGWQIKPGICQKNVEMGTRFGAHFLVWFFVQGVDREVA